jgi:pseudoazurin
VKRCALALAGLLSLLPAWAGAAEHVIAMRSSGGGGAMVFEPALLRVAAGDSVVFRTTQGGGHRSESVLVPPGAQAWQTETDVETKLTLSVEGVYLYVCEPHRSMGMVGALQVGRALNLKQAKLAMAQVESTVTLNKGRLRAALANVR